jgi:hypothetical protein
MLVSYSQSKSMQDNLGLKWYTDVKEAPVVSKYINKPMLLFFTGSDIAAGKLPKKKF